MHIKSDGVERGVLQTTKVVPFIFISLELSQELGTKIKYYNQKDAPIPLITWEIIRVLGALCEEPGAETNVSIFYHLTPSNMLKPTPPM